MPLSRLPRRTFLRTAGVAIGLPLLDAMLPQPLVAGTGGTPSSPRRMVLIGRGLGLHAPYFFPEDTGKDYTPSRYLKLLEDHRQHFTVFSGMSHRYGGGHGTLPGLLTGAAPENMRPGDVRNTISLDQEVAGQIASPTRFASLQLGHSGLSYNHKGMLIPSEGRAVEAFKRLFITGTPAEIQREVARIQTGQSILDGVREQARSLGRTLGTADRQRIDLLFTSIREAEARLNRDQEWVRRPKPDVDAPRFTNNYYGAPILDRERQWYDLVRLALQTDSTRVISLFLYSHSTVQVGRLQFGHHEASHHGRKEDNIARLALIEEAQLREFSRFLSIMRETLEQDVPLLDSTQVLYTSDLGNASAHTTANLPVLLAGGGFRHAGHVQYDRDNNLPMSNLFVRMLQQQGLETDTFGSSTGVLAEV
ncbi:MAG: DUF1552 domain-containing protein [Planctomycetaceae bacterium]|nr:DUF1552 domain-containing protein [Planctomycetaceae bacterium]